MIAVDTNVLVYAHRESMPQHGVALATLRELAEGHQAWALPIFCVTEFLRVVSHPRIFPNPTPALEAHELVMTLLDSPSVRVLMPGDGFFSILADCLSASGASGNLIFDAQIVAVCLEHGARTLLTEDRDFARFSGITVRQLVAG